MHTSLTIPLPKKTTLQIELDRGLLLFLGESWFGANLFSPKQLASFGPFFIGKLPRKLGLNQWASIWLPDVPFAAMMSKTDLHISFYC